MEIKQLLYFTNQLIINAALLMYTIISCDIENDDCIFRARQHRLDSKGGISTKELVATPPESSIFGSTYIETQEVSSQIQQAKPNKTKAKSLATLLERKWSKKVLRKSQSLAIDFPPSKLAQSNNKQDAKCQIESQLSGGFDNFGYESDEEQIII